MTSGTRRRFATGALTVLVCLSCDETPTVVGANPGAPSAAPAKRPMDRLAPGELAPGDTVVFGFRAPRALRLQAQFPKSAHLRGPASPEAVANYVRERVAVKHVEIAATRTVFPRARIKQGDPDHIYRIEVVPIRGETEVVIRDITAAPTVQGVTEKERWKRAGMTPDGKLADPNSLE
jgi:hypothetical protein